MNKTNKNLDSFEDSEYSIIKGLNLDLPSVRRSSPKVRFSVSEEREISIRELQFQEKLREIKRIKELNDSLRQEISSRRWSQMQDVLVKPNKKYIHGYLCKYNKDENRSVERISRSNSVFNRSKFASTVKNLTVKKLKAKPSFELLPGQLYNLTEKEETSKWNDITIKNLEEQVKNSINDVDEVLKLSSFKTDHK